MFAPPAPAPRDPDAGKRTAVGIGLGVLTVLLLLAGVTGVHKVDKPQHPLNWDPRVADLAHFVEGQRGMLFDSPVAIDFLTEDEFRAEVTTDDASLSDGDRADIEQQTAEMRALGLVEGDFDLLGETNEVSGDTTLAYYDPETQRITVRGTELTPYLKGTLVHELTHALQDQHFDLDALQTAAGPDGDFRFRAVVEGDAVNVDQAYRDQLSDEDKDLYDEEEQKLQEGTGGEEGEDSGQADYAPAIAAFFGAPYAMGPSFVSVLDAVDGNSAINDALTHLPSSDAAIFDMNLYFDKVDPTTVEQPDLSDTAEYLDGGGFGALNWYLVLSSRLDAHDALSFVDAWSGDSYTTYREGDQVCVKARYQADTPEHLDDARNSLKEWAGAMPADAASVSDIDSETIELQSCDPGTDAEATIANDVSDALALPVIRLQIAASSMTEGGVDFDAAWCYADAVVDGLTMDELQSDELTPEIQQVVIGARSSCRLG